MHSRLAILVALSALTGCYYRVTTDPLPLADRSAEAPIAPAPYVIHVGDRLGVQFYQNPELNNDVIVRPDGKISLQLVGDLQAAGIEPVRLSALIDDAYRNELTTPRATVVVRELGGKVYIGGEVNKPGVVPLTDHLTLVAAVESAGGFRDTAHLSQVVLIRRDARGQPVGFAVDVRPVIGGLDPGLDVPLQSNDVAYIPRSKIADVNLFVKQYIRDVLPIQFALPIF
jgi:protein involved in polysaccharide export with SLBB domain